MIQLQLKPEVEAKLQDEARVRGLSLDQYIAEIVESRDPATKASENERRKAVEDMLAFNREYKLTLQGVSLKDLIHEGHKY